jgi:tetratricopeptide (TPR) repeat protein
MSARSFEYEQAFLEEGGKRYRLDAEIGRGGMGVVYRARDLLLDRDVAIKVLSATLREPSDRPGGATPLGTEGQARLLREAQAVAQLNHPNVVAVYDAGEIAGTPFVVMEWVEGPSLHQVRPDTIHEIVRIARQVCTALEHAHGHGIIHRDLKPENVLLAPDGTAKLVDFGLARTVASRLTADGTILGTVQYIAPEQALGKALDGRADLYALGVMLYELTTGRLPFEGGDSVAILMQHLQAPVVPPRTHNPEIPLALDALIVRLLAKQPEDRPASAAEVRQVLERLAEGPPAAEVRQVLEQLAEGPPMAEVRQVLEDLAPSSPMEGPDRRAKLPAFLARDAGQVEPERPVFVARERELAQLGRWLAGALEGHGRVVFVTGGPGRGKTALLEAFTRKSMAELPDLLVASGACEAYAGTGDPYLPFRDLLGMLIGDVEGRWLAGAISREHALRLWAVLPLSCQALLNHGPYLIETLVPGVALLAHAGAALPDGATWLEELRGAVNRQRRQPESLAQSQIFEQLGNVLRAVANAQPLLLTVDDMQWADTASIDLLVHLGRRLEGSRILVVCAYRPEEVALGRGVAGPGAAGRHPLEKVLAEFKRQFGDVWVDLAAVERLEGRRFVDALLESEPNCLDEGFRRALYEHTEGHPLFTVELLRAMQERGDLVRDAEDCWITGPALDWQTLPARVEGVIEERIGRLEEELREILTVASVEGEEFTAQVVAQVQNLGERQLLRHLTRELAQRHRLVRESAELLVGGVRLSRYRFAHALFQSFLYHELGAGERRLLHGEVARVLESLSAEGRAEGATLAIQLARHFEEAGIRDKAIDYLRQAGDRARDLQANQDAIDYYRRALGLLAAFPEDRAWPEGQLRMGVRLYEPLGDVLHLAGDHAGSRRSFEQALSQVSAEELLVRVRLQWKVGTALRSGGDNEEALAAYCRAEEALGQAPDPPDRAWWQAWGQIQIERILTYGAMARGGDMAELIIKTLPVLEQWGTLGQRLSLLMDTIRLHLQRDRYVITDEVLGLAETTLATSLGAGDLPRIADFRFALGFCRLWRGELEEAETELELARRQAVQLGDLGLQVLCLTYLAVVCRKRGQVMETDQASVEGLSAAIMAQMPAYAAMAEANLAWVAWREGRLSDVEAHGQRALDLWGQPGFAYPFQWAARWPLLDVALARQQLAEAVVHCRALLDPQQQRLPDPLTSSLEKVLMAWDAGKVAIARGHLEQSVVLAREFGGL